MNKQFNYVIYMLLLLTICTANAADNIKDRIVGKWESSQKNGLKLVFTFNNDNSFVSKSIFKESTTTTTGKYSVKKGIDYIYIDLFLTKKSRDLQNVKLIMQFVGNDSFKLNGNKTNNLDAYPTTFGEDTLLFNRSKY